MATTCTIDRITGVYLESLTPALARSLTTVNIPGGRAHTFETGNEPRAFDATFHVSEATVAAAKNKAMQLMEIADNYEFRPVYIQFAGNENIHDGWFALGSIETQRDWEHQTNYPLRVRLVRIGGQNEYRLGTVWTSNAETYSGANWTGALTAKKLIALPYNVTYPSVTIDSTRTSSDGSNQITLDPARSHIAYLSSSTVADWFKSDCRVYDSVTAGDTTEANWVQVFGAHVFGGDCIIQNGLLRYKIASNAANLYVYDSSSWVDAGQFKTKPTGTNAPTTHYAITKLTSEVVEWGEIRQYGGELLTLKCQLRRGAYHIRVKLTAGASGLTDATYVQLAGTNYYDNFFNASDSDTSAGADLTTDTTHNYHCAYNTSRNIVAGFALTVQPSYQPKLTGDNDSFAQSNTWAASTAQVFFLIGFPQSTGAFNLTTGRATANAIAQQCLYNVEQELALIARDWFV